MTIIKKNILFLLLLALGFVLCLLPTGCQTKVATEPPPKVLPQQLTEVPPDTLQELPEFLDQFLPAEGHGATKLVPLYSRPEEYIVLCKFTLAKNYENEPRVMEQCARDFIFATYEACYKQHFPIISATILIKCPDGKSGIHIGLGKKFADTIDPTVWEDRSANPERFMSWMRQHRYRAPDAFQKCTYAGIYAK